MTSFSISEEALKRLTEEPEGVEASEVGDIGRELNASRLRTDDARRSDDDRPHLREAGACIPRQLHGERDNLVENRLASARIGRFGDLGADVARDIRNRRRDLGAPEIDPDDVARVAGDLIEDRGTPDVPARPAGLAHPALLIEAVDDL